MAPKEQGAKKPSLTLSQLASYDDILTDALVDNVFYWTTIRKNRAKYNSARSFSEDIVTKILLHDVVCEKDVSRAQAALLKLPGFRKFVDRLETQKEKDDFKKHMRKYISIWLPDCPFEVSTTNRYTIVTHEAAVFARRPIKKGESIKYLCGTLVALTAEEEKDLDLTRQDFSIVTSSRRKTQSLFLGPARFANHDCDANAKLITVGSDGMQIVATREISLNEEITVTYGDDYFGVENCECLCRTCEVHVRSGWTLDATHDHSVLDTSQDTSSLMSRENSIGPYSFRRKRKYGMTGLDSPSSTPEVEGLLPSKRSRLSAPESHQRTASKRRHALILDSDTPEPVQKQSRPGTPFSRPASPAEQHFKLGTESFDEQPLQRIASKRRHALTLDSDTPEPLQKRSRLSTPFSRPTSPSEQHFKLSTEPSEQQPLPPDSTPPTAQIKQEERHEPRANDERDEKSSHRDPLEGKASTQHPPEQISPTAPEQIFEQPLQEPDLPTQKFLFENLERCTPPVPSISELSTATTYQRFPAWDESETTEQSFDFNDVDEVDLIKTITPATSPKSSKIQDISPILVEDTVRENEDPGPADSILTQCPPSSPFPGATQVLETKERENMTDLEEVGVLDLKGTDQEPRVTLERDEDLVSELSELSELSETEVFDDDHCCIVRKGAKKPRKKRSARFPVSATKFDLPQFRHPGDFVRTKLLLGEPYSRYVDCSTCRGVWVQQNSYYTRRECPRCERHSKLYGYQWPKTERFKNDPERIMDHRTVHRFIYTGEELKIKKRGRGVAPS